MQQAETRRRGNAAGRDKNWVRRWSGRARREEGGTTRPPRRRGRGHARARPHGHPARRQRLGPVDLHARVVAVEQQHQLLLARVLLVVRHEHQCGLLSLGLGAHLRQKRARQKGRARGRSSAERACRCIRAWRISDGRLPILNPWALPTLPHLLHHSAHTHLRTHTPQRKHICPICPHPRPHPP